MAPFSCADRCSIGFVTLGMLLSERVLKLTACTRDIRSARISQGGLDSMFCGNVNPFLDSLLLAWFERRFRHCVDGNQIHVTKKSFAELQKLMQIGFLVVHVFYHNILERDAPIRGFDIACKAALQFGQGERIRFRHKLQSRCLV